MAEAETAERTSGTNAGRTPENLEALRTALRACGLTGSLRIERVAPTTRPLTWHVLAIGDFGPESAPAWLLPESNMPPPRPPEHKCTASAEDGPDPRFFEWLRSLTLEDYRAWLAHSRGSSESNVSMDSNGITLSGTWRITRSGGGA